MAQMHESPAHKTVRVVPTVYWSRPGQETAEFIIPG